MEIDIFIATGNEIELTYRFVLIIHENCNDYSGYFILFTM